MREEEATSQFDSPCISRVCSFTMAEIWLANLTISLEESINHRSNEMATVPSVSQWRRNIKTQVAVAERMERTEKKQSDSGLEQHEGE
ncbi:hypothetical protein Q8A67_001956 [Cirrhinus molitorella]|uniref:Uncharacterized protein n=1 Tax=Cirrhinus molitorella TaxID=172907 RepID=A0AA88Q534_9TELE|nr:hypothetical protein Q8A67_001956 [Cirrhinus molitorella]